MTRVRLNLPSHTGASTSEYAISPEGLFTPAIAADQPWAVELDEAASSMERGPHIPNFASHVAREAVRTFGGEVLEEDPPPAGDPNAIY